jgi:2,5-diketo-D-gluconate reductase B
MQPAKGFTIDAKGASIQVDGYGTMESPEPEKAVGLVVHAIHQGYRHIDTARKYGSEQWVGEGIRASGVPRSQLWVTTKVTEDNARADDFARSVLTSLRTMGLDYVDLLLIHWPQPRVPLAQMKEAFIIFGRYRRWLTAPLQKRRPDCLQWRL